MGARPNFRGLVVLLGVLALSAAAVAALVNSDTRDASAAPLSGHAGLVDAEATADVPPIDGHSVVAVVNVGRWTIAAGNPGHDSMQPTIVAFDTVSGEINADFRPTLTGEGRADVFGLVEAGPSSAAPTDASSLFAFGSFTAVDGVPAGHIAKFDSDTGARDGGFVAIANGPVRRAVSSGRWLYIAGDFSEISGTPRPGLARIDTITGEVDSTFDVSLDGEVIDIALTEDDRMLVMAHTGTTVGGLDRPAIAVVDVSDDSSRVTEWRTELYDNSACGVEITDVEIHPSDDWFAVAHGGDDIGLVCGTVVRFPIMGFEDLPPVAPRWVSRTFGPVTSLAVANDTIYVGGSFTHLVTDVSDTAYPGALWPDCYDNTNQCYDATTPDARFTTDLVNTGFVEGAHGIGALDALTGRTLGWAPLVNRNLPVASMTATSNGLFVGYADSVDPSPEADRLVFFQAGPEAPAARTGR